MAKARGTPKMMNEHETTKVETQVVENQNPPPLAQANVAPVEDPNPVIGYIAIPVKKDGSYSIETQGVFAPAIPTILRQMAARVEKSLVEKA